MSKNIILWGVGWLGLPLAQQLKKEKHKIFCLTRNEEKKHYLNTQGIDAITTKELIKNKSVLKKCDVFILTVPPTDDRYFLDCLHSIIEYLPSHSQFIYTSSTGIYFNTNGEIDENSKLDTSSKVYQLEHFIQQKKQHNLTILRLGGLIGPKRHPVHYLVKNPVNSFPNHVVNLIQQIDVLHIISLFIQDNYTGIFNLCSSEHPTRENYYSMAAESFQLGKISFENDNHETGKIVVTKKLEELFPELGFTSIFDFEKCT